MCCPEFWITAFIQLTWWRHQMETFSALLAICVGNSPVPGEFPAQRPVTRSFDVLFDLRLNKRLSKQWWSWWFETLLCPLWRHRNDFWVWVGSNSYGNEALDLLTHLPRTKWPAFRIRYFQMHFLQWKVLYFDSNFTEFTKSKCFITYCLIILAWKPKRSEQWFSWHRVTLSRLWKNIPVPSFPNQGKAFINQSHKSHN